MKVLDLFSGIGGFSLGLERAGFETVAFCEIDKKAHKVLQKHWPHVPIFEDVQTLTKKALDDQGIAVDVICGGFPCQDISAAGRGAGLAGEKSGLWFEFNRLIKEIRPKYAIIENVSALRSRGLDEVLRSLAQIGYDAEWHCIPASAIGAPHRRDRIWIVAYPIGEGCQGRVSGGQDTQRESIVGQLRCGSSVHGQSVENWWATEPKLGRVAHGIPNRVDRIKQLGNSVVPQIVEIIGRNIMKLVDT